MTDLEQPTAVRWKAAFCQAMWTRNCEVEGLAACRCDSVDQAGWPLEAGKIRCCPTRRAGR